jgi:drug/metabolite transporter (DMT)-like permease
MPRERPVFFFYALMVLAMLGWGASWVHVKYLSGYLTIHEIIFYRYLLTALSMLPLLRWLGIPLRIDARSLLVTLLTSLIMILYTWLFIAGTKLGTAGLGGAFVTTLIPIVTFVLMALLKRRHLDRRQLLALTLGALGVMTILDVWSFRPEEILRLENLYFVLAALSWGVLTILGSGVSGRIDPLLYSSVMYGAVTLVEGAFLTEFSTPLASLPPPVWANLFLLALFSTTFATSIYFIGGKKLGADRISSFTFLVPFSAIGLSALFLGERISGGMLIGTVMAVVAIWMLNGKGKVDGP